MSRESAVAMLSASSPPVVSQESPGLAPQTESPKVEGEAGKVLESTRFAHLAKKEQQLVKEREEFKKEREQILVEKETMRSIHEKLKQFEDMKVKDPVAALKLAGFTDTDLFNFLSAAEDKSTPEEKAAKAAQTEIQKFRDEVEAKAKADQEVQNKRVIDRFKTDITAQLATDVEKYEYCNHHGPLAEELIYATVEAVLEDSKELITVQEAADMVESYYEEQDKAMDAIKKRKPKAEAAIEAAPEKEAPLRAEVSPRPPSKTLNSKVNATVASTVTRKETPEQKRERLIEKLRNIGKQ